MRINTRLQGGLGLWVVKKRDDNSQSSGQHTCLGLAACPLCECVMVSRARPFVCSDRSRVLPESCSLVHSAGGKHWILLSLFSTVWSVLSPTLWICWLKEGSKQFKSPQKFSFFPAPCQHINAPNTLLPGWPRRLGACSGRGSNILQKTVALLFENATDLMKSNNPDTDWRSKLQHKVSVWD